ncbi:MAG: hypothetical protein ABI306_00950 [Caulobacteraceae bacterium]
MDGLLAATGTISTASGWRDNPALGPHSLGQAIFSATFVFALWAFNVGLFLTLFAALPWAILHRLGLRSWWIAPLAGLTVAFCVAFTVTTSIGQDYGVHGSSIDGKPTMTDGHLTAFGVSLYNPMAGARAGLGAGAVGAGVGLLIWRIAYRRPLREVPKALLNV